MAAGAGLTQIILKKMTGIFEVTDPKQFLGIANENLEEARADGNNARKLMNAAIATYHVWDWVVAAYVGNPLARLPSGVNSSDALRRLIASEFPDLALLGGIANGSKHFALNRPTPFSGTETMLILDLIPRPGSLGVKPAQFIVDDTGRVVGAIDLLQSAVDYWTGFIAKYGAP